MATAPLSMREMSEDGYANLKNWADNGNVVSTKQLEQFVTVPKWEQRYSSKETYRLTLEMMKAEIEVRKKAFGASLESPPFESELFQAFSICEAETTEGGSFPAVIDFGLPDSWEGVAAGVGLRLNPSAFALSKSDLSNIKNFSFEKGMGSLVVGLIDSTTGKYFEHHPEFYHWPKSGPLQIHTGEVEKMWLEPGLQPSLPQSQTILMRF